VLADEQGLPRPLCLGAVVSVAGYLEWRLDQRVLRLGQPLPPPRCPRYLLYRSPVSPSPRRGGQQASDARCVLDERLARGEIDPDECRRLRITSRSTAARSGNH
jgi:hypothetical protein